MTRVPDGTPTPAQLRAEYEDGASTHTLAVRHRISTGTVRNRLRTAETVMRPPVPGAAERTERNRRILSALAREPGHALFCADIAEQLGLGFQTTYRTLQRLIGDGLITSHVFGAHVNRGRSVIMSGDRDPHNNRVQRPYRLTESGFAHAVGAQSRSTSTPEPLITAITAQILLALLQQPIRSWRAAELAHRVPCQRVAVIRFAAAMESAEWATTRRSMQPAGWASTRRTKELRVDIMLTDHGVNHAKAALRREYGDGPTLIVLANAMHPPAPPIEV